MTFNDVFKSSFLESVSDFSMLDTLLGMVGAVIWVMASRKTHENPYMLVLNLSDETAEKAAVEALKASASKYVIKAKTVTPKGIELSYEVKLKDASTAFVSQIGAISGVESAALISYNGEYMS